MLQDSVRNILKEVSSYEFEVLITDMYFICENMVQKDELSGIAVTRESQDGGIDSICFRRKQKQLILIQASQGSKNNQDLKNYMNNDNIFMHKDFINFEYDGIQRVILTLENSRIKKANLKIEENGLKRKAIEKDIIVIDGNKLIEMVTWGFKYLGIIDLSGTICQSKLNKYLYNIHIKSDFWRIAHNYINKKNATLRAKAKNFTDILNDCWKLLLDGDLDTLLHIYNLNVHTEMEFGSFVSKHIEGVKKVKNEDIQLFRILYKISNIADVRFNYKLVRELTELILETINNDLTIFEIKVGCKHLSLKYKMTGDVIGYFTYQSTLDDKTSYHYRFYCSEKDINIPLEYMNRVTDTIEGKDIKDIWHLRQTCYLLTPNVRFDRDIIRELIEVSIRKYLRDKEA